MTTHRLSQEILLLRCLWYVGLAEEESITPCTERVEMISRVARKCKRVLHIFTKKLLAQSKGIQFFPPNYIYLPRFDQHSTVIDAGCADDPELAIHLMSTFGVKVYAVDPTRKHAPTLQELEAANQGRFHHVAAAVASQSGNLKFFESQDNVSGSLLQAHANVQRDQVLSYEVKAMTIADLMREYDMESVDLMKLDLEGAEYSLLGDIDADQLSNVKQLFVEFHHHCLPQYSLDDTRRVAAHVETKGFEAFSLDGHNFLFYRTSLAI